MDGLVQALVVANTIRDAYLKDASCASNLCKPKGGKKRKTDEVRHVAVQLLSQTIICFFWQTHKSYRVTMAFIFIPYPDGHPLPQPVSPALQGEEAE